MKVWSGEVKGVSQMSCGGGIMSPEEVRLLYTTYVDGRGEDTAGMGSASKRSTRGD